MRVRASRPCGCEAGCGSGAGAHGPGPPGRMEQPRARVRPGRSRAQQGRGHDGDVVLIAVGVAAGGDHDGVGEALVQPQQVAGVPRARRSAGEPGQTGPPGRGCPPGAAKRRTTTMRQVASAGVSPGRGAVERLRAETVLRALGVLGEGRPDLLADLTFRGAALTIVGIERSLSSAPDAHFRRRA